MQTTDIYVDITPRGTSINDGLLWTFSSANICSSTSPCLDHAVNGDITLPNIGSGTDTTISFHLKTSFLSWNDGPYMGTFKIQFLGGGTDGRDALQVFKDAKKQSAYSGVEFGAPVLTNDPLSHNNTAVSIHDTNASAVVYYYKLGVGIDHNGTVVPTYCDPKIKNGGQSYTWPIFSPVQLVIALLVVAIAAFLGWKVFRQWKMRRS